MRIDVLTLFPEVFEPFLASSIVGRAIEAGIASVQCVNFREFAHDKHHSVDDRPFGGGPGMVLMCQPIFDALEKAEQNHESEPVRIILTPQGERLSQPLAAELARERGLVLVCGHYEGFDERICQGLEPMEISVGDFITNGGEVPAMLLIDSVIRMIPNVLGDETSSKYDSFAESGLLEYPQYTRPREFRGMEVPEILLSGNHREIENWRKEQSLNRTKQRREDLWKNRPSSDEI